MTQTAAAPFVLTLADFRDARARIAEHIKHTPLLTSRQLSEATGYDIRLKAEMFQRVGSYKIRGPLNKFAQMPEEEKRRGVVCSSAGNHAQGVALAAKIHGIRAVVCMATNATPAKVAATRGYGAEVVLHGEHVGETLAKLEELRDRRGLTVVHPFDQPEVVIGNGSLGLELLDDLPDVDVVVAGVGGGGLISGVTAALKAAKPDVRIYGVEPVGSDALKRSIAAGRPVTIHPRSVADGLNAPFGGRLAIEICGPGLEDIVLLEDATILGGLRFALERLKLVLEPAGATALAAVLSGAIPYREGDRVAVILSGGNVAIDRLGELLAQAGPLPEPA